MILKAKRIAKLLVKGYKSYLKRKMISEEKFPERVVAVKTMREVPGIERPPMGVGGIGVGGEGVGAGKAVLGKAEEIERIEGVELPEKVLPKRVKPPSFGKEEVERIALTYPLIPRKPSKGEHILAHAKIFWDPKEHRYFYQVIEPPLTDKLKDILKKVKDLLEQKLDVDFSKLKKQEAVEYLKKQIAEVISYFGFRLTEDERRALEYYAERDFIGLGKIEPLMRDGEIEDISCDGVNIPIFVFHRNPKIGSVITNVVFEDREELDSFVIRLAQLCGKSISVASPLLDGSLPDGSRVQATLGSDIARRGSNFTIRKFTEKPFSPIHLLHYGTLDVKILAYLWLTVDYGRNVLVSGGTASGKTTLLNVLSLFIRPERKIVSIEDTAELKLPHPHWVPQVARVPIVSGERKRGEIDLFDLLKESLRQRPDYIIVGEVRGPEAFVLFQEMATGHPSMATIHAENKEKLIDRLISPPISLTPSLIESLDVVVFIVSTRYRGKQVRRISEVFEILGWDKEKNEPVTNLIFKWNPMEDKFETVGKSVLLKKIAELKGMKEREIIEELKRRALILQWMFENNIIDYQDVYKVISSYYAYPQRVLAVVKGGM